MHVDSDRGKLKLDSSGYPKKRKVTDVVMKTVKLRPHRFHSDWNYSRLTSDGVCETRSICFVTSPKRPPQNKSLTLWALKILI